MDAPSRGELYPKNPPNTCKRGADHVFPFRLATAIRLREPRSVFRYFRVATRFMTTQTAAAQQCFRSRPLLQEKGSVVSFFSCMARQKRTHGVSLHECAGVSPTVPSVLQRLLAVRIRLRIILRHLQLTGIEFDHLAAGTFRLAFEMLHKLTHSPPACRPSEATLKRSVIVFLNFDRAADLQQIVHKLTVVALAGSRQAPMVLGKLCRRPASAIACVPSRRTLFHGSVGILVVGIVRSS